jgi:hypothetical protein
MIRPNPLLKIDVAEKLASPLILTPHHLTSESLRESESLNQPNRDLLLQQPALMFAFKGRRAVFYSAAADCADRWCAQQETGPEDAG